MRRQALSYPEFLWAALIAGAVALVAALTTPYMAWATFAYLCMVCGLYYRFQRRRHALLMGLAILVDIGLVLILEYQRSAVATAAAFRLTLVQQAHIVSSLAATLLYFPVAYLGLSLLFGKTRSPRSRLLHLRLGLTAFVFRTLGFILMFSLLEHVTTRIGG